MVGKIIKLKEEKVRKSVSAISSSDFFKSVLDPSLILFSEGNQQAVKKPRLGARRRPSGLASYPFSIELWEAVGPLEYNLAKGIIVRKASDFVENIVSNREFFQGGYTIVVPFALAARLCVELPSKDVFLFDNRIEITPPTDEEADFILRRSPIVRNMAREHGDGLEFFGDLIRSLADLGIEAIAVDSGLVRVEDPDGGAYLGASVYGPAKLYLRSDFELFSEFLNTMILSFPHIMSWAVEGEDVVLMTKNHGPSNEIVILFQNIVFLRAIGEFVASQSKSKKNNN